MHLTVRCESAGGNRPGRRTLSEGLPKRYPRTPGDLLIAGREAIVDLHVRRFRCYEPECPRKTFVEQAPVLAERYAHRTLRLRSMLQAIGVALGADQGVGTATILVDVGTHHVVDLLEDP